MFARFAGQIHFQQNARMRALFSRDSFHVVTESQRINPMKQLEEG